MADNQLSSALNIDDVSSTNSGLVSSAGGMNLDQAKTDAMRNIPADVDQQSSPINGDLTPPGQSAPAQQVDLPRFQRTFGNTLKGMLVGFGLGGIVGSVQGAADPQRAQEVKQQRADLAAAKTTFANAQAAHEVAMAHQADLEYQYMPAKLQQEQEQRGLETMKAAEQAGFLPVAQVSLDQGIDQNAQSAMTALNQVKQQFGAVPSGMLYIHTGSGMTVMRLQDPNAALPAINQVRRAQGLPEVDAGLYATLPMDARTKMAQDAINFTSPIDPSGMVTQGSLNIAQMRLATVKAQPDFTGKDNLVSQLQATVDHQKQVLDSGASQEAIRKGQAAGAEAQAAQPGETAAKVANIKATAGPEAAAAGMKAEATAKGTAKGQLEASGGAKDANGNWNQASLPVMLVEGNADPSQIKNARSGMSAQAVEQAASQYSLEKYGKPFDMAKAQTDYKFANSAGTQNTLKYLNSLTGADNKSGNLGELIRQSDGITRTKFPALNDVAAWARLQSGDPGIAAFHATVTEVADQVAKIMQGGGGNATSDLKMKQAMDLFNVGFNKDQIRGVGETLRTLLANRKGELIGDNRYLQKQFGQAAAPTKGFQWIQ